MLWKMPEDFLSLFHRGTGGNENYLEPIDGFRALANLSIIFLHILIIYTAFVLPYPHQEWQELLISSAFALNNIMVYALEIFFMLSGFLLTYKLLTQWRATPFDPRRFLEKDYPLAILKRVLRFWPGILLSFLILFFFGEPRYPNSGYLFEVFRHLNIWMFFQNYIDPEYWYTTLAPLWSISLDMQMHVLLPLGLCLFYWRRSLSFVYNCLWILLILSIVRGMVVYDPATMFVGVAGMRYPSFQMLSPVYFLNWIQSKYNLTLTTDIPRENAAKLFTQAMYLPLEARFGSFVIGAMLAIKVLKSQQHETNSKTWKKYFYYALVLLEILSMFPNPHEMPPQNLFTTFGIASIRQLFTIGQAFLLFTALCPRTHPYHAPWLRKFLSLPIWIPISKLSYLVYIIHWRVAFELIFRGPLRLKGYSVTHASLICLPIVLFISQVLVSIWYVAVEKPFERAVQSYFSQKKSSQKDLL